MSTEQQKAQALEILKQLGGNRFLAMTGSSELIFDDKGGLSMKLKRNSCGASHLKIELTSMDTYTMTFEARRLCRKSFELKRTTKASFENVYCDQLQSLFTHATGLYTRL